MDLSIIIVSWNVKDLLRTCLQSIYTHTQDIRFEVFVVDNASHDGSAQMVTTEFPQVHLLANTTNQGFGKANNQGLLQATGKYILFLNDDTEISSNIFKQLITHYNELALAGRNIGMMGCRLNNPDHTLQPSVRAYPTVMDQTAILLKLHHVFPNVVSHYIQTDFDYTKEQVVDQVMGAFMLTTRDILNQTGAFDENFFVWFEEVDLQKRIRNAGYDILYTPIAACVHVKGASFTQLRKPKAQIMFNRSMRYYFKKHHSWLAYVWICAIQPLSVLLAYAIQGFR